MHYAHCAPEDATRQTGLRNRPFPNHDEGDDGTFLAMLMHLTMDKKTLGLLSSRLTSRS